MITLGHILDILVLLALGVTIGYAFHLSRQLNNLKIDRTQIEALIFSLSTAVSRAENAIKNMRQTALESGDALQKQINVSRELFDELQLMTEAGHSLADRLQVLAERGRAASEKPQAPAAASRPAPPAGESGAAPAAKPKSRAEKELIEAMQARERNKA